MSPAAETRSRTRCDRAAASAAPLVKANELVFVHFERPDLDRAERYLTDFGLVIVSRDGDVMFLRGAGSLPFFYRVSRGPNARFRGLWAVGSVSRRPPRSCRRLSAGRSRSRTLRAAGQSFAYTIPKAWRFDVMHGFARAEPTPLRPMIPHNAPDNVIRDQRHPATGARAAAGDQARPSRPRGAGLRRVRALVHGHLRLHSVGRDVPARRRAGRRLHAPRPRSGPDRPSHAVRRAPGSSRRSITWPSRWSISTRSKWASRC